MATAVISTGKRSVSDRYLLVLAMALLAYAMLGRGFAYTGVPPLFVSELLLAAGILVVFWTGAIFATFASIASVLLSLMMTWALLRTIPYVGPYGITALRDSVIIMYGAFAFITMALLLEKPDRLKEMLGLFGKMATVFVFVMPFLYLGAYVLRDSLPTWSGSGIPVIALRPGEVAVHLCGAALFGLLGFRRLSLAWLVMLIAGITLVSTQSRGGMLAILIPIALAMVVARKGRQAALLVGGAAVILGAAYVLDIQVRLPGDGARDMNVRQMVDNLLSIVVPSGNAALDGTKEWRLRWWDEIVDYTLHGDYFWTGKGFGINLAEADGFLGHERDGPPLRSPHNGHLTVLARAGVPGLALWLLTGSVWFYTMFRNASIARRRGDMAWASLFILLPCYLLSIVINASFDVALEGPMLGIWFWVLFGTGVAASMIYRSPPDLLIRPGSPPAAPGHFRRAL